MGILLDWLKQLAADCTEQERQSLRINNEQNPSRTHPPTAGEQQGKGTEAGDCDNP